MGNSHQLYSFPVVIFSLLILDLTGAKQNLSQKLETVHRLHTYYRNSLLLCKVPSQPPAYDMEVLRWNKKLARNAQQVANKCDLNFDLVNDKLLEQFESVGQNVAETDTIENAMENWFRESHNYNYEIDKCNGSCSNYRQMVWAQTKHIGCGLNKCKTKLMIVCNYSPSADDKGKPYVIGDRSQCARQD
ncbi:unnamed protein product [Schistosoma bovis]|nr:unnamed protein product [Schistosoma bovis]